MKKYAVLATLMLLAIGLGSFQYWAVSDQDSVTASIGDVDGRVNITALSPGDIVSDNIILWRPFKVDSGKELYNITLPGTYNGEYTVTLHLANAGNLAKQLRYLIMKVSLYNGSNGTYIKSKWLSLTNGRVQFEINQNEVAGGNNATIKIDGGSGKVLWPKVGFSVAQPQFVIDVEERASIP